MGGGSFSDGGGFIFKYGGCPMRGIGFGGGGLKKILRWGRPPPSHYGQACIEKQSKAVVKRLLDVTYSKRRKLSVTDYTKISTILELYPTLCSEQQMNEKPFCLYLHSSNSFIC